MLVALVDPFQLRHAEEARSKTKEAAQSERHHAVFKREKHRERVHELQRGRQEKAESAEQVQAYRHIIACILVRESVVCRRGRKKKMLNVEALLTSDPGLQGREAPGKPLMHDLHVPKVCAQQEEERTSEEREPVEHDESKLRTTDINDAKVGAVRTHQDVQAREDEEHRAEHPHDLGPKVDSRREETDVLAFQERFLAMEILVQPDLNKQPMESTVRRKGLQHVRCVDATGYTPRGYGSS